MIVVGIVGIIAFCYLLAATITMGSMWLLKKMRAQLRVQFRLQSAPPMRHAPQRCLYDTMPVPIGDIGRHVDTSSVAQNDDTIVLPPIDFEAETPTGPIRKIT